MPRFSQLRRISWQGGACYPEHIRRILIAMAKTGPVRIESMDCLDRAVDLIRQHRLFLEDWHMSHTQMVLDEHEDRCVMASPLLHAWIAFLDDEPVGAAMVCKGSDGTGGLDTVSLFVKAAARGRGLGEDLLDRVLARFPAVAAFHTPEAQGLYGRKGLPVAFFSRPEPEDMHDPPLRQGAGKQVSRRAPG